MSKYIKLSNSIAVNNVNNLQVNNKNTNISVQLSTHMHAKFYKIIGRYILNSYFGGKKMRRRSRTEVIVDVLSEALGGANKTRIMYRANLNFLRFNKYFDELLDAGLVEVFDNPGSKCGGIVYRTTEKGRELLKVLEKAKRFIEV